MHNLCQFIIYIFSYLRKWNAK